MATAVTMATRRAFGRRTYVALGVVLLLLYGLVAIALFSFQRLARATDLNIHTYEVLDAAQEVRIAAVNIQTGYRGFVLTGDSTFLEPLEEGREAFARNIANLRVLVQDNPNQLPNIDRATSLHEEWERVHIEPGLAARRLMPDSGVVISALLERINPERGRLYLEGMESLLDEIRALEIDLLDSRRDQMATLEMRTTLLLVLGGLFGVLAASALAVIVGRQTRRLFDSNQKLGAEVGERRRAETSLARVSRSNELLLQAAGEGICGLDADGRLTFMNPSAERMLGWSSGEVRGRTAHEIFHHTRLDGTAYPFEECPVQAALSDGASHDVESEIFWRNDGTNFPVRYIATPIVEEGEITGGVVTFSDITERRAIDRMKDEFVSVVSHELRTPLTAIRGSLGLLASGGLGTLPERGQRMLEIASQNTDRLVRLINDILDIERIESGKIVMQMRDVSVASIVEPAIESVRALANEAEIELIDLTRPGHIHADSDRLIQVLTNLLGNAIKFSEPGSSVEIASARSDGELEVTVTDHGRGIPEDKLETIFGRFQQVDASDSRKKGGTGLGLAIARSIVDQHGGRIWAEQVPAGGSRFHFTLPVGRELEPSDDRPLIHVAAAEAEVDPDLTALLIRRGYRLRFADKTAVSDNGNGSADSPTALLQFVSSDESGPDSGDSYNGSPRVIVLEDGSRPAEGNHGVYVERSAGIEAIVSALEVEVLRSSAPRKILLVEDDTDLAAVITATFAKHSVTTQYARHCREASQMAKEDPPDLIILDLMLEGEDGFDLASCFRHERKLQSIPLVVYSALDLTEEQRARLGLGSGTHFVTKGRIPPEEFERLVMGLLNGQQPEEVRE